MQFNNHHTTNTNIKPASEDAQVLNKKKESPTSLPGFKSFITETKEYILWAIPKGKKGEHNSQPIYTQGKSPKDIDRIKTLASASGWHSFRTQIIDVSKPLEWNAGKMVRESKTKPPTWDEWRKIWDTDVPHWSYATQLEYQKKSKTGTGGAFSIWCQDFRDYFKTKWNTSVPTNIVNKICGSDGSVTWNGERYNLFSERRELMYAIVSSGGINNKKPPAKSVSSIKRSIGRDFGQ